MGNLYFDYTYDAADRCKDRAMAQFAYESYKYNGNGQRIEKYSLDEEESYSEETSKYYYQGGQVLYTEDETAEDIGDEEDPVAISTNYEYDTLGRISMMILIAFLR